MGFTCLSFLGLGFSGLGTGVTGVDRTTGTVPPGGGGRGGVTGVDRTTGTGSLEGGVLGVLVEHTGIP
jgi:hypothetical protein